MARLTELDLSYHTEGLPDRDTYLTVASACLNEALPGDLTAWAGAEHAKPTVTEVWFQEPWWPNEAEKYPFFYELNAVITEHPFTVHWRAHPDSEPVLRVSDCVSDRELRSSRAYRELFVPVGLRYELAIVTVVDDPAHVDRAWTIGRFSRDFTADDLWHARYLQPMLALLDTVYPPSAPTRRADRAPTDDDRPRARLTARELEILTLLAEGRSAQQIARLRRISVRTVHKHLENIYEKLGCHNRLLAVNKAARQGLLRG